MINNNKKEELVRRFRVAVFAKDWASMEAISKDRDFDPSLKGPNGDLIFDLLDMQQFRAIKIICKNRGIDVRIQNIFGSTVSRYAKEYGYLWMIEEEVARDRANRLLPV